MQIIISIMIVGLLWMIYDLINAPEVDEDENFIVPLNEEDLDEEIEETRPEEAGVTHTNASKNK
ncbi:hypothetical protein WG906_08605 [Pedobacter sp. P351]|uniref:hypothetical protein n=1 Tax=Pedobacter superstes TaxID=3133441 RepID=UPI0030B4C8FA